MTSAINVTWNDCRHDEGRDMEILAVKAQLFLYLFSGVSVFPLLEGKEKDNKK